MPTSQAHKKTVILAVGPCPARDFMDELSRAEKRLHAVVAQARHTALAAEDCFSNRLQMLSVPTHAVAEAIRLAVTGPTVAKVLGGDVLIGDSDIWWESEMEAR